MSRKSDLQSVALAIDEACPYCGPNADAWFHHESRSLYCQKCGAWLDLPDDGIGQDD